MVLVAALARAVSGQQQFLHPQTNTFNSSFTLSDSQIASLNLSDAVANNINIAVRFEQTNWATGSVLSDPFYTDLPSNASKAPAGSLLKLEAFTDTSTYTIAPTLALSRILYQSKTLNGSLVPVSAYILWPYLPHGGGSAAPLVAWGHGTSGIVPECAPSHVRNLWYQFSGPYALALAGYAVVASDYAGLGVPRYPDGTLISHQYVASPAAGNDLLYAAQAAKAAFPHKLSKNFVVMGHSQGGGAAWAAAQQQVREKVPGYIGAIAASPATDALEISKSIPGASLGLLQVARSMTNIFPGLSLSSILTKTGIAAIKLLEDTNGCSSMFSVLIQGLLSSPSPPALVKEEFLQSGYAEAWSKLNSVGGKKIQGPLLILHGTDDPNIPEQMVSVAVKRTCEKCPKEHIEYVRANAVGHVPIMYATQQIWLDWLEARFREKSASRSKMCTIRTIGSKAPRPLDQYQGDLNYFLEAALDGYQVA